MTRLILILAATGALAFGQGRVSSHWAFELSNGVGVAVSGEVTSDGGRVTSSGYFTGRAEAEGNTIHRSFPDSSGRVYFGYDLIVEKLDANRMRVSVRPLSTIPGTRFFAEPPAPGLVSDGDKVELDVMEYHIGRAKVMDRFLFSARGKPEAHPTPPAAPRDLTIGDIWLQVSNYVIRRNGVPVETGGHSFGGNVLIVSLPGDGAIALSLVPTPGYDFKKVAVADNDRIVFSIGNNRYEWISSKPIIQYGGTWNVWMYHDPSIRTDEVEVFSAGSPGAISSLKR